MNGKNKAVARIRRANGVLTGEAREYIESYRSEQSSALNGCDHVEVNVFVPGGRSGIGGDIETIFAQAIIGPRGTAERVVEVVAEICRMFDRLGPADQPVPNVSVAAAESR